MTLENAFLIMLECPAKMRFGIDNSSWEVGNKFKGVKMIPPGAHYVHYSLPDEENQFKTGFWIYTKRKDIVLRRWNQDLQTFLPIKGEEALAYEEAVQKMEFDAFLGPYPVQRATMWQEVTNYIDETVLFKIEPMDKVITSKQYEYVEKETSQRTKFQEPQSSFFFSMIPTKKAMGLKGEALTMINFDKTPILEALIKRDFKGQYKMLLGELQFAFIVFMIGENADGLDQWRELNVLMCHCNRAVVQFADLYIDYVPVLYSQMKQLPRDFFKEESTKNNFLCRCISNLLQFQDDEDVSKKLRKRVKKLRTLFISHFETELTDPDQLEEFLEDEEDRPVIVELPSNSE
eukprot:CAMPEP_0115014650 /NCGR_PEP_ID=MMETSP0216-20121206/26229_1 /TAXON_ID=223996 /ORGANISM="Protocruzia adherens, Strain Boccale" /LENGTH=346 /DNA_ID=CAMNT_0002384479 /DNA_START=8 /DNA_END=1045 /DNA_ORIENTATION=+